jgi:predicted ATPase/DNA-binding SARP family transcriptional activator/DNA-binding CsgD family transcriptional regulator
MTRAKASPPNNPAGKLEGLRIRLLGEFSVSIGTRTIEQNEWRLKRAASLVKLLALAPSHRLHREQVMDEMWPDSGKKAAANRLREALHAARRTLDPVAGARYLASEDKTLVLNPKDRLWVDVEAFEEASVAARRTRDPAAYRAALDLYTGDLLPIDRYEEWAEQRREELRRLHRMLLVELSALYEERTEYGSAVDMLRRAVAEEPTMEEAHVGLMRLYALCDRKSQAITQYDRLEKILSNQLDAEPSTATRRLYAEIMAGKFPAPRTPPAGPQQEERPDVRNHNLPTARTSFVGREREILEIKRELSMSRLLSLTGAGGSGKTRLALEVARDLVGAYPDGVWLVELAPLSEEALVPQAVAGVLDVRERPDQPLTDSLIEALRQKTLLVILDNCEHVVETAAHLVTLLLDACPRLKILATGREVLGIMGEVVWPVPLLSVPDVRSQPSVEELEGYEFARLFAERVHERNPNFTLNAENAHEVAEICRRLDGLPLAIELAAARSKVLPPNAMRRHLGNRLELLRGAARDLPQRQRSLRATIEWSYELLDSTEKVLLARLSAFCGGCTLEAVEAVCDAEADSSIDVLEGTSSLLEKSLLRQQEGDRGEPRFVMLETVHEYARERLDLSEEAEEIRRRHAEYFLALAEQGEAKLRGSEEANWLVGLETERHNMRAALTWALEKERTAELGLRIAGALWRFWWMRGYYDEGRRWLERALAKDSRVSMARAKALEAVGWLADDQDDIDRAVAAAEEGLSLSTEAEIGSNGAAPFLRILGAAAGVRGDHERAAQLYEESLALSREVGDERSISLSLLQLGNAISELGDYRRAIELYEEGLALSRKILDTALLTSYLISMGYESLLQGDVERGAILNEEAARLMRERGHKGKLQYALDNLGWAALLQGDRERARQLYEESLRLCRELGDITIAAESLEGLACAGEEAERAARLFGVASSLREAVGYRQAPRERAMREPYLESVHFSLEESTWDALFTVGQAMTLEEGVEYALATGGSVPPKASTRREQEATVDGAYPDLTRREREVASLVVQGLTNRQIASELVISERTVDNHVTNIFKKFALTSREQVAALLN